MLRIDQVANNPLLLSNEELAEMQDLFCENLDGCEVDEFDPSAPETRLTVVPEEWFRDSRFIQLDAE